jgi:phage terminase small subunit
MKQIFKPLDDLSRKLVRFADNYAKGVSIVKAALEAGYSRNVAESVAYQWIGKTKDTSKYPELFIYYEALRKEKLRLFDVTVDSIVDELKRVAFSDISNYLDLPSEEVHSKVKKLSEKQSEMEVEFSQYEIKIPKKKKGSNEDNVEDAPVMPPGAVKIGETYYRAEAKNLLGKLKKVNKQIKKLEDSPGYRLRLKFKEHIPAELLPAVAEIRETRDGISVKLHSKMDALDKLARWQKMYEAETKKGEEPTLVKDIILTVSGSQSTMLQDDKAA